MKTLLKNLRYAGYSACLGVISGCTSLPPGNPPPENEPIIKEPVKKEVRNLQEIKVKETDIETNSQEQRIREPELVIPAEEERLSQGEKKTEISEEKINLVKAKVPDGADAVNYMMIMLATKCPPIATPEGAPPKVLNEFTVAVDKVNDFPLQVWNKLINNSMIRPVSNPEDDYFYIISSSIDAVSRNIDTQGKHKYIWKMNMLKAKDRKQIWHTAFEFSQ
jgi:hypothetical protein